ncbi:hypothetical protein AR457_00185 [Streptomyces agglomeratus]|uniref:Uncharacterized protein n=1 Tax=Streptomyces agglomeratus TaxID=285458 RepID=A0A1E5P0Y3_9ACTN|nr:hypothetical protein [Streptomyces agglomeratus]OEJ21138.1 hypothetical protein AR457_41225 [Streptomyces agglomeratus]OEJ21191.1 hypothetical protein AS594_36695 [Streptomyces agglomeratus]OEJ23176.1 hypothetical protein AS594_00185 [Streptomyces agglomeratus]OEJ36578.1 hypothetical protein BGK72_35880 [Streptomyces agglomeratus]OEJ42777.1 hypothetical protein AR457_00185 [Streptomyces agglomeratus]
MRLDVPLSGSELPGGQCLDPARGLFGGFELHLGAGAHPDVLLGEVGLLAYRVRDLRGRLK